MSLEFSERNKGTTNECASERNKATPSLPLRLTLLLTYCLM
jgi:hypothetical protein